MGVTKRAGRKAAQQPGTPSGQANTTSRTRQRPYGGTKKQEVGVTDLTLLSKISNEAINDNLKLRFENESIYTYIGEVLISVNPFRDLGLYTEEILNSYWDKTRLEVAPHVFAVAEAAYKSMSGYKQNQCVIISGESGAGKTEAAKQMMQYISSVAGRKRSGRELTDSVDEGMADSRKLALVQATKQKVLATNPLLESFGNAKTLRNNNSSRFGKYLELQFNDNSEPIGAKITNYLLEKSRVVGQIRNERNFHIFYQFTKAANQKHKDSFSLQGPDYYLYLSKSGCFEVDGIDDVQDFRDTVNAMNTINLNATEQDDIFKMVAAILWIGNITFVENEEGNAVIADANVCQIVGNLLGVSRAHVEKAITIRVVETSRGGRKGSVYEVPLNIVQATAVRDALAKAIYFNLFDWIVRRLNESLVAHEEVISTIGILDIYGFEIFERNSFEQLCINYVNEKLQQIFIELTLRDEQATYEREQIQWTPIKYFDNKIVCDLIEEKRPPGVFAALNDACATAHADSGAADQTFVQRLNALSSNPHFQPRQGQFVIKHYAGDVHYAIETMTDKNKDQVLKDLLNLLDGSKEPFLRKLFPNQVNQDDKRRPPTAGDKIKASANELVATLRLARPSYIRTIKPNENKSPKEYNVSNVLHQVKYLGLQENVRIRRAGFAYRRDFEEFVLHFFELSRDCWEFDPDGATEDERLFQPREPSEDVTYKKMAKWIMADNGLTADDYQMGTTMIFIKAPQTIFQLENLRSNFDHLMAKRLQRVVRGWLRRRKEAASRIQAWWRNLNGTGYFQKERDQGHMLLQGRKERRRFSLVGSRRYLGDYLGINNTGGPGEYIRQAMKISNQEMATFSCRCELLVSKFGRSSKPEPRFLILTNKAIYIVATLIVEKSPTLTLERTIPIGAVKFISTSSLKDDWFSIGVSSPQEADPLVSCVLKTEFFLYLNTNIPGRALDLRIKESIEYNKKPGKLSYVKVVKDPTAIKTDFYKSGTVHTSQGEPASSVSRPTPKPKAKPAKPLTQGKLIRPGGRLGGPIRRPSRSKGRGNARRNPVQNSRKAAQSSKITPKAYNTASSNSYSRPAIQNGTQSNAPVAVAPIAGPLPVGRATVLYEFKGTLDSTIDLIRQGEVVEVYNNKDTNWWEVKTLHNGRTGFAPATYLEMIEHVQAAPPPPPPPPPTAPAARIVPVPPARPQTTNGISATNNVAKAKSAPPAPPKRPIRAGVKKPLPPPTPRDSAVSMSGSVSDNSGRATPDSTASGGPAKSASGLAAFLREKGVGTPGPPSR